MDLTLTAGCWTKFCSWLTKVHASIITTISFIALLINTYRDRLLPLLRQFLLLPKRINKFMTSERIFLHPALNNYTGIWSIRGDLFLFRFSTATSTSKTKGQALVTLLHVCLSAQPHEYKVSKLINLTKRR